MEADQEDLAVSARDAVAEIESRDLAERAEGYRSLADALRAELEHSDQARG